MEKKNQEISGIYTLFVHMEREQLKESLPSGVRNQVVLHELGDCCFSL
jgi:hypothetical protein